MKNTILLLILATSMGFAQTATTDSLLQQVRAAATSTEKLAAIFVLADHYKSLHRDTLDKYAYLAQHLAAASAGHYDKAGAQLAMSYMYGRWGWTDSSLVSVDQGLALISHTSPKTRDLYFKLMRQKAMCFGNSDRLQEALSVLYELVEKAEEYHDALVLSTNLNSIASIALARGKPAEALNWLARALSQTTEAATYQSIRATIYLNLADSYRQLHRLDSAEYFITKGIELTRTTGNLDNLAIALQRQSAILLKGKKTDEAERPLLEMLDIRKQLGDPAMWVNDNIALATFYIESNQVDKAIAFCQQNLRQGQLLEYGSESGQTVANNIKMRLIYYEFLARCYKIKGENIRYSEMLEQIVAAKDSFYEANSAEAIAELQTRYDVQKKENTIIQQQYQLLKKDYFLFGILGLLVVSSVAGWLILRANRKRQQLKTELILQKEKEKAEKAVSLAEEAERKRIAADLHDSLGTYAASIVSNVEFIKTESEVAQKQTALNELHHNSMAIVTQLSDTIWVLNKQSLSLINISDRIKNLFFRLEPSFPSIHFSVEETIQADITLPAFQAFHLYQIMKEAVNNAIRHSNGTHLSVWIESTTTWAVCIRDNGNGMTPATHPKTTGGNGLSNIRNRAAESGWSVEWRSSPGGGTAVWIRPTTNWVSPS